MKWFPYKVTIGVCVAGLIGIVAAQPPRDGDKPPNDQRPFNDRGPRDDGRGDAGPRDAGPRDGGRSGFGRGGFGPGGPGGPGGPREDRELVEDFDRDDNGWLNKEERAAAREFLKSEPQPERDRGRGFGPPGRGPGGRGGPGARGQREPATPGPQVSPEDVMPIPDAKFYDQTALRTIFLEFENDDWEAELEDFHGTDVDVAAALTIDGKTYPNVGIRFRGMSSYGMVSAGHKRSFNVSVDLADEDQRVYGYKTLNLLNCSGDPSMMSTVLYSEIARQYIPTPKANHVRVVVNGESWGVYVNVQQFDKIFLKENFPSSKGTRWKVSGSPGGDGGLRYLGDDIEEYKARFDMKSNDGKKAWTALIELCRTLNETPLEQLESALEPMLDIDGVLKFLALDVALVNSDGYWTRASDYSIFLDDTGRFHLIPHDMNEAFHSGGPPRGFGPPPGGGPPGFGPPGFGPPGSGPPAVGGPGFGPPPEGRFAERADRPERRPDFNGRRDGRDRPPGDREPRDDRNGRGDRDGRGDRGPRDFGPPPGRDGMRGPGGPGHGGPGHGGVDLDPLVGLDNPRMPLRSRLLAVPELRTRYLEYVREIAEKSMDWKQIGPVVIQQSKLIHDQVAADTRKLDSLAAFEAATSADEPTTSSEEPSQSLRSFFQQRREFLRKADD